MKRLRREKAMALLEQAKERFASAKSAADDRLDATIEYQRIGAIKGSIIDSDGTTVISNLFTAFSLTQQTATLTLGTSTADIRGEVLAAMDKMENALGAEPYSRARCLCGKTFFRTLVNHDHYHDQRLQIQAIQMLQQVQRWVPRREVAY